jgi:lipid-A-disaccharide synthase
MAACFDSLATIVPFEKQCFAEVPLDVNFVGHPFVEEDYVADIFYNSDGPVLLLPGSRVLSVRALFPIMLRSFREILKQDPARMAVAVYPDETILAELRKCLCKKFPELSHKLTFVPNGERIEASAAIMSSGTMSLKCCLAGIPGAIVYKTHPFTYMLGKFLVQVKFIGIANILLDKCVWREFLQSRLRPKSVAKHILQCLNNEKVQSMFKSASQQLRDVLSTNRDVSAAQWLLSAI